MRTEEQWIEMGRSLGATVAKKNAAYGDSVRKALKVVQTLYPDGITYDQIPAAVFTIRIVDKLSRIANDPEFGGEDPALDIGGYSLLMQDIIKNGI